MSKITIVTVVSFLFLFACQNDPSSGSSKTESQDNEKVVQKEKSDFNEIKPFERDPNKRAWSILTADMWHFNFALNVLDSPTENVFEGYWLDFEDDFTYTKGLYNDVVAEGEYDFDIDSKILEMIPSRGDDEPSQWKVKTNGEVIILIGTSKYGNNATQIKLVRERERPINR